jgi:two-component sensor histidine kinase
MRWVFLVATVLGLSSTAQAYRLTTLLPKVPSDIEVVKLLFLNLTYWYVPAVATFLIFRLTHRFPLDSGLAKPIGVHAIGAVTFSVVHMLGMLGARTILWWPYGGKNPSIPWEVYVQNLYIRNLDWALMTYASIAGIAYALTYTWVSRERAVKAAHLEARLAEARLRTLEAELHPHFLFNTLHAISTLVHSNPESADRMISRLSDLLRLTFDRSGAPGVSLQEELEFLQKYLEIEQIRFQDRLTVRFDIEPETLDAEVPRMILQPLVENAIKHGVSPRSGPGLVQISARRRDDRLWLEIRDNGGGLAGHASVRQRTGVGLTNTRDRLECLYGGAYRLHISDSHDGLAVEMEVPLNRAPATAASAVTRVA